MPVVTQDIGKLIQRDPALRGGRPIVAGTGICVRTIAVDSNHGLTPEGIAADREPLNLAQVHAALAYYHSNKAEIDADIEAENRIFDEGVQAQLSTSSQ